MSVPVVAFFNSQGGVGKTTLVYHLAWMYGLEGVKTLAIDLDPQADLTARFLDEDRLEEFWHPGSLEQTIASSIEPVFRGISDLEGPVDRWGFPDFLIGDPKLALFEDALSEAWLKCNDGDEWAFRVTSAFWRIIQSAGASMGAQVILMDLGPNLGAINRAGLIAADLVVTPIAADLISLQGLRYLGPRLAEWRTAWRERLAKNPDPSVVLPKGVMRPAGYVVVQHPVRLDRPVRSHEKWMKKIPSLYATSVLGQQESDLSSPTGDPNCLKVLRHYGSLIQMADEARKPIFNLTPADGAIGAHLQAVKSAGTDFNDLATKIYERLNQLRS